MDLSPPLCLRFLLPPQLHSLKRHHHPSASDTNEANVVDANHRLVQDQECRHRLSACFCHLMSWRERPKQRDNHDGQSPRDMLVAPLVPEGIRRPEKKQQVPFLVANAVISALRLQYMGVLCSAALNCTSWRTFWRAVIDKNVSPFPLYKAILKQQL